MSNRICGNVYVIDSQTGAANALQPGSASWLDNHLVTAFAFLSADTTGSFELVFAADTSVTACFLSNQSNIRNTTWSSFGDACYFKELRCKTLTAGTGFIYFL